MHPRDVLDRWTGLWISRVSELPIQQDFDLKRQIMDDMWLSYSQEMRDMLYTVTDFEVRKMEYKLTVLKALRTIMAYSAEMDAEADLEPVTAIPLADSLPRK